MLPQIEFATHILREFEDLAVPLAVFSVVLSDSERISCALGFAALCILAKDLAIIADRVSDAVIVLRITLGYLVCTAPDAIMGITGLIVMLLATKACTKALLGSLIVTGTPGR